MKRKLFNLAAIVSMLLCIGTSVLWVRSYWYSENGAIGYRTYLTPTDMRMQWVGLRSMRGSLTLEYYRTDIVLTDPQQVIPKAVNPDWLDQHRKKYPEGLTASRSVIPVEKIDEVTKYYNGNSATISSPPKQLLAEVHKFSIPQWKNGDKNAGYSNSICFYAANDPACDLVAS